MALASTTVPRAAAPFSITVFPSTTTGSATVAEKPCPELLLLELRVSPSRTVITCFTGLLATGLPSAVLLPAAAPPGPPAAALGLSVEDAGVAGWLVHPKTKLSATSATTYDRYLAFNTTPFIDLRVSAGIIASGRRTLFFFSRNGTGV